MSRDEITTALEARVADIRGQCDKSQDRIVHLLELLSAEQAHLERLLGALVEASLAVGEHRGVLSTEGLQ